MNNIVPNLIRFGISACIAGAIALAVNLVVHSIYAGPFKNTSRDMLFLAVETVVFLIMAYFFLARRRSRQVLYGAIFGLVLNAAVVTLLTFLSPF